MTNKDLKTISKENYYHALALYMLAVRKNKELDRLVSDLDSLLEQEEYGHTTDAIYDTSSTGMEDEFQAVLLEAGIKLPL